jgi:hypothetical protein
LQADAAELLDDLARLDAGQPLLAIALIACWLVCPARARNLLRYFERHGQPCPTLDN